MKIKGISPVADHWRTKAESLERSLALKGLQAEAMREAIGKHVEKLHHIAGAITCYASTINEYPPNETAKLLNGLASDLEQALNERKEGT